MSRFLFRRPSPAMVVACLALTISLTGVGYAAVTLANNSVGTRHLKPKAVVGPKVAANTIHGKHVLESSLGKVPTRTSSTARSARRASASSRARAAPSSPS